jgi:O-antigen/teichoic acid export membrane protein
LFEPVSAIRVFSRATNGPLAIFVGRGAYAVSQFAMLAAVGRCCGTEAVGDVVLGLAVAVPLFALFGGQLRLVQATDASERFAFPAVERAGLVGHGLGLLVFAGIAFVFRSDAAGLAALLGVGLARAAESWSEISYGALQRRRNFAAIGISTAAKSVAAAALALCVLVQSKSPGAAFAASGLVWLIGSVAVDRALAKRKGRGSATDEASAAELLRSVLPLSAGATVSTFDTQTPRYFVEACLGSRALGLFGVTHYAALSILTLIVPLTYAWTPALAADVVSGDHGEFRRRSRRAVALAGTLGAATSLAALPAGPLLATMFSEPALAEGWTWTFAIATAGILAPAAALEAVLRAAHGFRVLCALQIASLIVHVGACATGLGWFGLEGAAGGMLVRAILYLGMLAVSSRFVVQAAFDETESAKNAVPAVEDMDGAASARRAA